MPVAPVAPATVPGRTLLVDGDYLAYYCGGSADSDVSAGEARAAARERIEKQKLMSGAEHVVVHLTDGGSTKGERYLLATVKPYQGNRSGKSQKPKHWGYLRDWMQTGGDGMFKVKTWGDREADDGAAYHAMVLGPERTVLTCADKDWRMIPGWHLDWKSWGLTYMAPGTFRLEDELGKLHGELFFWWQCIRGDSADHIPGLPYALIGGKKLLLGEARADQYLASATCNTSAFAIVGALYKTRYGDDWPIQLAEQMSLLWMRRDKTAEIDDCLRWMPERVAAAMQPAFNQLKARVAEQYAAVNNLCKS
ncbi:RNaseH [Pseudomonas phage vB_PpuP-Kurepalu-1]